MTKSKPVQAYMASSELMPVVRKCLHLTIATLPCENEHFSHFVVSLVRLRLTVLAHRAIAYLRTSAKLPPIAMVTVRAFKWRRIFWVIRKRRSKLVQSDLLNAIHSSNNNMLNSVR